MANVKDQPQYQLYLAVINALQQSGYTVEEFARSKKSVRTKVKHGANDFGEVFVVVAPPRGIGMAVLKTVASDTADFVNESSEFAKMHSIVDIMQKKFVSEGYRLYKDFDPDRCRVRAIWSSDGLVCAVTSNPNPTYPVDEWLKIPQQVMGVGSDGLPNEMPIPYAPGEKKSGGCYVATCVYGSYDCPEVWTLRRFRDDTLSNSRLGRKFIRSYYAVSSRVVKLLGDKKWFNKLCKPIIDEIVVRLQRKGVDSSPYMD